MASTWYTAPKRKVFVSYHHGGDQAYYDEFSRGFCDKLDIITDRSLDRARDSNDPAYIMRYIRENHLTGASTLIVLCGVDTPYRKFVDWEISAGLAQQMALLGVKLPDLQVIDNGCSKSPRLQDNIDSQYAPWVWWNDFSGNPVQWIEEANARPKSRIVNNRQRRVRNG